MPGESSPPLTPEQLAAAFYFGALKNAEQVVLEAVGKVEGLDAEIDALRVRLRELIAEQPEEFKLMLRSMEILVRLVSARYRMSKTAEKDLSDSIGGMLRGISVQLYPEGIDAA